jgi:signal peptidase I
MAHHPDPANPAPATSPTGPSRLQWLLVRLALAFLVGLSVIPSLAFTVAQPWQVRGHSMEPSLEDGSMVFVDALGPWVGGYARGDVVIAPVPPTTQYAHPVLVKRIIALGGDRVRIERGRVSINGALMPEPYLAPGTVTLTGRAPLDVVVPAGAVFVMGDHRANSFDSTSFGPIPASSLLGRAWLAVAPGGELELPGAVAGEGR